MELIYFHFEKVFKSNGTNFKEIKGFLNLKIKYLIKPLF